MNYNIEYFKKSNSMALLLGLFAGDGCLSNAKNGDGNKIYPIRFYNTKKEYVLFFNELFQNLFNKSGSIKGRIRKNRKILWQFEKYSVKIYKILNRQLEIPNGKKALKVFVPSFIKNGAKDQKVNFFLGLLLTDGGIRANGTIIFHSASKRLIYDLQDLIKSVWNYDKKPKKYIQKGKYISYQLNLNKGESYRILKDLPTWHNLALR